MAELLETFATGAAVVFLVGMVYFMGKDLL